MSVERTTLVANFALQMMTVFELPAFAASLFANLQFQDQSTPVIMVTLSVLVLPSLLIGSFILCENGPEQKKDAHEQKTVHDPSTFSIFFSQTGIWATFLVLRAVIESCYWVTYYVAIWPAPRYNSTVLISIRLVSCCLHFLPLLYFMAFRCITVPRIRDGNCCGCPHREFIPIRFRKDKIDNRNMNDFLMELSILVAVEVIPTIYFNLRCFYANSLFWSANEYFCFSDELWQVQLNPMESWDLLFVGVVFFMPFFPLVTFFKVFLFSVRNKESCHRIVLKEGVWFWFRFYLLYMVDSALNYSYMFLVLISTTSWEWEDFDVYLLVERFWLPFLVSRMALKVLVMSGLHLCRKHTNRHENLNAELKIALVDPAVVSYYLQLLKAKLYNFIMCDYFRMILRCV
jgi:hypothetical protein